MWWLAAGLERRSCGGVAGWQWRALTLCGGAQAGDLYNALRVYRAIEGAGMQPNVITCCGLISALGKARRPAERAQGCRLWHELHASGQHLDAAAYRTGESACRVVRCHVLVCRPPRSLAAGRC